jgi:mRNA interferase HicA
MCEGAGMTGDEFERKIRRLGRRLGFPVSFDRGHGKGSHGRLYYGARFTTLKDRKKEIGPGLLKAMLDQLGLTKDDLESE